MVTITCKPVLNLLALQYLYPNHLIIKFKLIISISDAIIPVELDWKLMAVYCHLIKKAIPIKS